MSAPAGIARVGVVGAGSMGTGIAQNAAESGFAVALYDNEPGRAGKAAETVAASLSRAVERGRMTKDAAVAAGARLAPVQSLDALAACDLVIEAVFEDETIKCELFARLSPLLGPGAILATNTSSLRVDDLARSVANPARFLGLHYFIPAAVNKLVELVRGAKTGAAFFDRARDYLRACGKEALACRDSSGFVVNRFFCPFVNEAARLLDEGHAPALIDRAARPAMGAPLGPFAVMNLTKVRIALHAQRVLSRLGPFYAPARALVEAGEADREWTLAKDAPPDREAEAEVAARLRGAAFLAVLQLIDEAVAEPAAIDLGARVALRWDLPPCATMNRLGRDQVARLIAPFLERYRVAEPASLARIGHFMTAG